MNKLKTWYMGHRELIEYFIFGVATTVVNIVVFFLFDTILGIPYLIANFISIVVAILFAFFTNKRFVFRSKSPAWQHAMREFLKFVSLRAVSAVVDMLSMWLLVDLILMDTTIAKIAVQFIIVILNYVFSKLYIFK